MAFSSLMKGIIRTLVLGPMPPQCQYQGGLSARPRSDNLVAWEDYHYLDVAEDNFEFDFKLWTKWSIIVNVEWWWWGYVLDNTAMATLAFCPPDSEAICWVAGEPPTCKYTGQLFHILARNFVTLLGSSQKNYSTLDNRCSVPRCKHFMLRRLSFSMPRLNRWRPTPNWPSIFRYSSCLWPGRCRCISSTGDTFKLTSASASAPVDTPQGPTGPQSAEWSGSPEETKMSVKVGDTV